MPLRCRVPAVDTEQELALVRSLKGRELGQGA